jgi:hypothetical protein
MRLLCTANSKIPSGPKVSDGIVESLVVGPLIQRSRFCPSGKKYGIIIGTKLARKKLSNANYGGGEVDFETSVIIQRNPASAQAGERGNHLAHTTMLYMTKARVI